MSVDRRLLGLVGITTLAAYLAIQQRVLVSWDGRAMASVALNLVEHGSLKECCRAFGAFPKDPGPYSVFGIGMSLLLAPLWLFQAHSPPDLSAMWPDASWLGLANPVVLTATTVIIAKTGLLLGWRRSSAVLAALAFALLTMAPYYSAELFPEPGVTLGVSMVLLGFVMWPHNVARAAWIVGCGVAVSILFRPDSIVLVAPVLVCLPLLQRGRDLIARWSTWLLRLAVPIAIAMAWTLYYNWLRFDDVTQFGNNSVYDRRGFSTPLLDGVGLLLWSPGLSFFVYAPILIASIPGIWWLARRQPPIAVAVVMLFVGRVIFYGKWWGPWGGDNWGPRFLLPLCAVLALPLGAMIDRIHELPAFVRGVALTAMAGLTAASVVVQVAAFSIFDLAAYSAIRDPGHVPLARQRLYFHNRNHQFFWTLRHNHIVWNLEHFGDDRWWVMRWFHNGPSVVGVGLLAIAAIGFAASVTLAVRADRQVTVRG